PPSEHDSPTPSPGQKPLCGGRSELEGADVARGIHRELVRSSIRPTSLASIAFAGNEPLLSHPVEQPISPKRHAHGEIRHIVHMEFDGLLSILPHLRKG